MEKRNPPVRQKSASPPRGFCNRVPSVPPTPYNGLAHLDVTGSPRLGWLNAAERERS